MTILVVEDDPMSLALETVLLEFGGHSVVQACSGEEALVAARLGPDLIVMDLSLPEMDGLEVTRRLKLDPRTRTIPVVAAAGHLRVETNQQVLQVGCVGLIAKPIDARAFVKNVEEFLLEEAPP